MTREALKPILGLSVTDRRAIEAHVKPRGSNKQRRLPLVCPFPKRAGNNIERRSMDDRSDQGSWHCSHILGLSVIDRRATEAHGKPGDSTRQRRLPPLCSSPKRAGNNIEWRTMDDKSDQGGTAATS